MLHIHTLSGIQHRDFLSEERHDPITGDAFQVGQKIVFCASCKAAFLLESWEYAGGEHCGQSQTLKKFPKNKPLIYREKLPSYEPAQLLEDNILFPPPPLPKPSFWDNTERKRNNITALWASIPATGIALFIFLFTSKTFAMVLWLVLFFAFYFYFELKLTPEADEEEKEEEPLPGFTRFQLGEKALHIEDRGDWLHIPYEAINTMEVRYMKIGTSDIFARIRAQGKGGEIYESYSRATASHTRKVLHESVTQIPVRVNMQTAALSFWEKVRV